MARIKNFDSELQRIRDLFGQMRNEMQPFMQMLHRSAEDAVLPDEEELAREEARLGAEIGQRRQAETALARLVYELSRQISRRKVEFEEREQPNRIDRMIGFVSRSAMKRRLEARASSPSLLLHLEELLRRGDSLTGMIRSERDLLVLERRRSESGLVTFIDHRPEIIQVLRGENLNGLTMVDATARVQRVASIFDRLIGEINHRIGTCNVMLHKLSADMEDVLILYQVVFEASRRDGSVPLAIDRFPSLARETERFSREMLTIHGLDARRERTDQSFATYFPTVVPVEAPAFSEGRKSSRWRLPRLRLARP